MKKSELRQMIKEELSNEGFTGKDFKEDDTLNSSADKLFTYVLNGSKKLTSNDDNRDLLLAMIYHKIEGVLDHGKNAKFWRKY